jgi:hypothetical protein
MVDKPKAPDGEPVRFVLKTDQAPEFWQFLNGLRGDDLLVELIVNELDARASHTEIRFEPDRLVCTGNGDPIDAGGWERLRFIKGAGHAVAAKIGLFGVKNHGLKACFTIGNDILLRSAGQQILQTLFADGPTQPPYPGVRVPPLVDPDAPATGTRIEVGYRRNPFTVPYGEQLPFAAITDEHIAALFRNAVETLPKRLLGIMRPGVLEDYTLTLAHHALGTHRFEFSAGRIKRDASRLFTFFRECRETSGSEERLVEREQACLAVSSERSSSKPRFFQANAYKVGGKKLFARDGLVVEVAWDVDARGKPRPRVGRLRYPVSYPGDDAGSASGTSCFYSGPFISDTERHELAAQSSEANDAIVAACDGVLATVLAKVLIPRHGARALALIGALGGDRLLRITNQLLQAYALPAVDQRGRAGRHKRGTMLVVPTYESALSDWALLLAKVAPDHLPILDPKVPAALVNLLASRQCIGWGETHLRFDAKDVIDRLERADAEYFPWRSDAEWRRSLGDPAVARAHLDAIQPYLVPFKAADRPAGAPAHLPDSEGNIHPLGSLKRGAAIPTALLELDVPPVIHPDLKGHPVFKLEGWKLDSYTLRDLLRDGGLEAKSAAVRRRLFEWIASNPDELRRDDWPAVKALPIWPSVDGSLHAFDSLCLPEPRIATALGAVIAKPARDVRTLCTKLKTRKPRLVVRSEPSTEEIAAFYAAGTARFAIGTVLTANDRADFHAFERALLAIGRNKHIATLLRPLRDDALALSRTGMVQLARTLVRETSEVRHLCLQPKDLLNRPETELDQILPPARKPGARMTLDALRDDPANSQALLPRLAVITASPDPPIVTELKALPCLPYEGKLVAPDALAFKGNLGEYWGGWKAIIGGQNLSDDAQDLYRAAGVIRSFPTAETSRAYFVWLSEQPPGTLATQISCVMRHVLNKHGVASWLFFPPEVPCVPIEDDGGVRLITLSEAKRAAVVNDIRELGDAIRADAPNPRLRLAIDSVRVPNEPIGDILKEWGIPALSFVAKEPGSPAGGSIEPASPHFFETVRRLAGSATAKRFRKQLSEVGVQQNLIEPRFQHRLFEIRRVMVATDLTVQFRLRGRSYRARRQWAVLPDEIWLDRAGNLDDTLMEAIADIVFKKPRLRYLGIVLKGAISQRAQDFEPVFRQSEQDDYDDGAADDDVSESAQPHPGSPPDPARNDPKPGELYTGGEVRIVTRGPTSKRPQVVAEDVQRKQLKIEHYASHCQMELAVKTPEVLAPAGSYAEHAENRIWMIQAHHPDKTSANGARHAGNLLILSKVNHEGIGTRLSRGDITEALRDRWTPHQILRPDGTVWLDGGVARAIDRVNGEVIPFFFTHWHRDYWLEMSPAREPPNAPGR